MAEAVKKQRSEISPSNADRWMNCPGSVALCRTMPKSPTSENAAAGTVAHDLLENALKDPNFTVFDQVGNIRYQDGFEIEITEEMAEAVVFAKETVLADLQKGGVLYVELNIVVIEGQLKGRLDIAIVREFESITVYDFKYGRGVIVSAVDNSQLLLYLLPLAKKHDADNFELVIIQPRTEDQVSRWECTSEYLEMFEMELPKKIALTQEKDAFVQDGTWCRWCDAKAVCPKLRKGISETLPAVKRGEDFLLPDVQTLTPEIVQRVLDYAPVIDKWIKAVTGYALDLLEAGGEIPGWELGPKRANRQWIDESKALQEFADLGEEAFSIKMRSPKQIEDLLGKEGKSRVEKLTEKPDNGLTLKKIKEKKDNGKK